MKSLQLIAAGAALALLAGCSDDTTTGDGPAKFDLSLSDGSKDGPRPGEQGPPKSDLKRDGAPIPCSAFGASCKSPAECCSGVCTNGVCAAPRCEPTGGSCKVATDCCSMNCTAGKCAAAACLADGASCTAGGTPCCSQKCSGGKCVALNVTCKTAGNPCPNGNADCCSKLCTDGKCANPATISYCTQVGDICFHDQDCCTGACDGATTTSPGTCAAITTKCQVDGTLCSGCHTCCSSLCAPFGLAGHMVCQPASGCHVQGDLCTKDSDCCGGDVTYLGKLPGAGLIKCVKDPKYPQIGICSEPNPTNCPAGATCNNCVPEGNVCHYKDVGMCESNATRNDCCGAPGNKGKCQLDPIGIPRCYGLGACVPAGGACASSADCCDNLPCVPDANGHLVCGAKCVELGGICTTTADCCTGLQCNVPPGALAGTCELPYVPPPPAGDGPAKDLGPKQDTKPPVLCALWGQACSTTVPCCANQGTCLTPMPNAVPCPAGATNCKCNAIID
jgi:hypothetical protein